jgi:hypothetical protein
LLLWLAEDPPSPEDEEQKREEEEDSKNKDPLSSHDVVGVDVEDKDPLLSKDAVGGIRAEDAVDANEVDAGVITLENEVTADAREKPLQDRCLQQKKTRRPFPLHLRPCTPNSDDRRRRSV